ncbi:hypothetical protein G7Y79_00001g003650 [Physcia stellaris]|nr:hypothetical protein G7Y79_00001g003650 [Physcia stellaris]
MVQWTPNVDALFFKVVLKIHDIKVDYKKAEEALREEGIDVTAKALMHRITKLKTTQVDAAEPGKASALKAAKRAADGKPKTVLPDPEDGDEDGETEKEKPKPKKAKSTAATTKATKGNAGKTNTAKGKKVAKKVVEEEDASDELDNGASSGMNEDGVAI